MKKQIIIRLAFLISASGLFFSCSHMGQKNVGAFEFDSLQVNKTTHLFGDTAKPACNLTVSLSYIKNSSDERIKDSLNAYFLSASLGEDYATLLPEASVKSYAEKYAGNYLNDLEPLYRKDEQEAENREDIGNWYSYYRGVKSHVQHYDGNLLVYRVDYNEYTGGAHGIYMSSFLNFNLSTLSPIRLDDLFVGEYKEQLTDLLLTN